jgi:hypothetical protein
MVRKHDNLAIANCQVGIEKMRLGLKKHKLPKTKTILGRT